MESLRILVIDDSPRHRESAKQTLAEHELTIASSFKEAISLLTYTGSWDHYLEAKREAGLTRQSPNYEQVDFELLQQFAPPSFDVVLTDMELPVEKFSYEEVRPGETAPLGLILAMFAGYVAVPYVAMVTDAGHHGTAMASALGLIGRRLFEEPASAPSFKVNGSRVQYVHAPLTEEGGKDWGQVLKDLLK